jgi:hypothetical protein
MEIFIPCLLNAKARFVESGLSLAWPPSWYCFHKSQALLVERKWLAWTHVAAILGGRKCKTLLPYMPLLIERD